MNAGCDPAADGAVHRLVWAHAEARPDHIALRYPVAHGYAGVSYRELVDRAGRIAAGLSRRGVGRGDRVVVLVPMSVELYAVLLAIIALGAVAVFVEPASTVKEIARVVAVTRPRGFVGIAKAHLLRLLSPAVAAVPVRVVVGGRPVARLLGGLTLAELEREAAGHAPPEVAIEPDDPALLTFSSGSTGTPKGAARSHRFLDAQHQAIERMVARPDGFEDVHMSAFAIVVLSVLASGMTAVLPRLGRGVDDVSGDALVADIAALGVTMVSGSPAFLAPIFAAARRRGPLAGVRRVASGGAPVPIGLCEAAADILPGGSFLVVYGSTEAEPIATIDAAEVRAETAALTRDGAGLCVGRIDPSLAMRLLTPSTAPLSIGPGGMDELSVAAGAVGEIAVRGPHVNRGYYRNKPAERQNKIIDVDRGVWHRTGDAGYLDDRGRLWLVGRVIDIVRRGAAEYHPSAVEAAAQTLAWVDRAALVGDGAATLLVVQPRSSRLVPARLRPLVAARRRADEVTRHLAARGVVIDRVRLIEQLPVDPRHRAKLDYPAIRRRFL